MASNYTCRACARALHRPRLLLETNNAWRTAPSRRTLARSYHATTSLLDVSTKFAAPAKPNDGTPARSIPTSVHGIAAKLREKAPLMTETYVAYGATQDMIKECIRPGEYTIPQAQEKNAEIPTDETGAHLGVGKGWWYETLGLKPTFINWAQITFIHMYMLQVRFRMFPETHAPVWIQHLTNHAFYAAEDRLVIWHKLNANSLRQKYLKDMFSQWRAVLLSYDEGLVKGDAVLAAALWRNLFAAREDVDFEKLAQVVGYMRREMRRLDMAKDDDVARGTWKFGPDPSHEENVVRLPSRMAAEVPKPPPVRK